MEINRPRKWSWTSRAAPWDCKWISSKITEYLFEKISEKTGRPVNTLTPDDLLEADNLPPMVVDNLIKEWIENHHSLPPAIQQNRIMLCISTYLKTAGYKRRSQRGHAWDLQRHRVEYNKLRKKGE